MASVDDLCQRLGIQHPLDQSTCIGYGQRKPTCGLLAAESSRLQAVSLLDQISCDLSRGSAISSDRLHTVAGLLLCRRWHQVQAHENARRWKAKLEKTMDSYRSEQATTLINSNVAPQYFAPYPVQYATQLPPAQTTQSLTQHPPQYLPPQPSQYPQQHSIQYALQYPSSMYLPQQAIPQQVSNQPSLRSCTNQELVSELRTRLDSSTDTQLLAAIVDITSARHQSRVEGSNVDVNMTQSYTPANRSTAVDSVVLRSIGFNEVETSLAIQTQTTSPQPESIMRQPVETETSVASRGNTATTSMTTGRQQTSVLRPAPTGEDIRRARIAALAATLRSPTPEPPVRPPSPLRSSYTECGVCMEPYEDDVDNHWECQSCLNRAHIHCFDTWRAAPSDRGVRCMYCRVEVTQ